MMKAGITKYGMPQVAVFAVVILAFMLIGFAVFHTLWLFIFVEAVLLATLVWGLAFFRDPHRQVPTDKNILLSPADGVISDIELIEDEFIGGAALRVGIFLNVFNVHINRMPCAARVEDIIYKPGKFKNALDGQSARVNEANEVYLQRLDEPAGKLIVRQISGAIARRIVCEAQKEATFASGEKFGMIKFGSRTELILPAGANVKRIAAVGDKVKAGETVLIRFE